MLVDYINDMLENYRGTEMYMPFGCDFTFANAAMNFENMDRMIEWFNKHNTANMRMFYSTPGQYIDALKTQNITWPTKYDDMFPYADNPQDYWSGYFASRQAAKKQVRDGQANLHASMAVLSRTVLRDDTPDETISNILAGKNQMLDAMGVYQHHDAVSGTAKQHVANNYYWKLWLAQEQNNKQYTAELIDIMNRTIGLAASELLYCVGAQNETVSSCPVANHTDADEFVVAVHNPAA